MKTAIWLLSLSIHAIVVKFTVADIDFSICNPMVNNSDPTPMPRLVESFTAHIEWKWLDRNRTIDVTEVQNSFLNMGSQVIDIEGTVTKIILDQSESQYITYTQKDGCKVTGLGTFAFYNKDLWLQSTPMLYNIAHRGGAEYKGVTTVRNTSVKLWSVCLDLFQLNITVKMDLYFSASWGMSMSSPDQQIPVRIEMKGSQNSPGGYTKFHVIGDYVDFNPTPTFDETQLQLPAGVFCSGRASRKPLNLLPESFSLVMEAIDQDYHRVRYEYIWYDAKNRLVRYDTKQTLGQNPDPMSEIFDFNLGVHYSIDRYMGNCEPIRLLSAGDLFVKRMGNHTRMESALEFFHVKNAISHYVGTRTTRGVVCDVWVGMFPDDMSGTNFTIEWYFTQSGVWSTGIGGVIETNTLFRMDIWEGGSNKPTIYNILQLDQETPPLSVFDISSCYPAEHKIRILLHFVVSNQGKLSSVGKRYLSDTIHTQLTNAVFIPPLRITALSIFVSGETDLYVDFILLDNAPSENKNIVPPPPKQHPFSDVLGFLKRRVLGGLNFSFNSRTGRMPVVVKCQGIQEINYAQRFTTNTVTTTTGASTTPPMSSTQRALLTSRKLIQTTSSVSGTTKDVHAASLEGAVRPGCSSSGWNITIDMDRLHLIYPRANRANVFLGDTSCSGTQSGHHLTFSQGLHGCLTTQQRSGDNIIYSNDLFYAIYDPNTPLVIRQHGWTITLECDVRRNVATSTYIHHDLESHHVTVAAKFDVKLAFFRDPNFNEAISGDPLHVSVGDNVYVKVYTTTADWTMKMHVHTCYTKPTENSPEQTRYYIIKNGCEVDRNTHLMSQSTHETRFMFQDFEYPTNRGGLNIHCDATFCNSTDFSKECLQICDPSQGN